MSVQVVLPTAMEAVDGKTEVNEPKQRYVFGSLERLHPQGDGE